MTSYYYNEKNDCAHSNDDSESCNYGLNEIILPQACSSMHAHMGTDQSKKQAQVLVQYSWVPSS